MRYFMIGVFVVALSALGTLVPSGTAHAESSAAQVAEEESSSDLSGWSLSRLWEFVAGSSSVAEAGEAAENTVEDVIDLEVVPRESWGAQGGKGHWMEDRRADHVIVHHFWRPNIPDVVPPEKEAEVMRNVERVHVEDNGWRAFGYHFVIFQSGHVYEGRGWGREGGHTVGRNEDSIGIVFAIDGDVHEPTDEAWEAAEALVAQGVAQGHLTEDVTVSGHTDHAEKSCPGELIQPDIQRLVPNQ